MIKEEIIEFVNNGKALTHIALYYNCSRTKLVNFIKKNFSKIEYENLFCVVHTNREKLRATKRNNSLKRVFRSKFFKDIILENCSSEQIEYIKFVLNYISENNITLHKVTKFLSRQIKYYGNDDDYYDSFNKYLSKLEWYAFEKEWWTLCYGKINGELKYTEHMNNFYIFSNGKKTEDELHIIKRKISKGVQNHISSIDDELYFKRNSPMCKEFYMYRYNMDLLDAIESAKKFCNVGSNIGMKIIRQLPKSKQSTTIEYWLEKTGGDLKAAKELLKQKQQTFSYKICVEKHGIENRYKIWRNRQELWLNTLRERGFLLKEVTDKQKYLQYKNLVNKITKKQNIQQLEYFELRGNDPDSSYHLDHKFSIRMGFEYQIDPNVIGNIVNLIFIPYRNNCGKREKCSITIEELLEDYNTWVMKHGKQKLYK